MPGILAVIAALLMTVLDVTIVNVALPSLAKEFAVNDSLSVWIITIYQLFITMLLLPISSVGDKYGYKPTFLTGVVIFTLASIACALSNSFAAILVSRALQGVGAATVMGVSIALTRTIYPRKILARGMALNAMTIAIATAAGPTVAGGLLTLGSWHWMFLVNIPFGLVAFICGYLFLPPNPGGCKKGKYDFLGALENCLTFGLLFYALGSISRGEHPSIAVILLFCSGAIGWVYIRRQLRIKEPMFPVDLYRSRLYSLSILTNTCSFIAQNIAMVALPFMFVNRYNFNEITTGLLMTPWSLSTMIVSPFAARFIEKHSPGLTASSGMGVYAIGVLLLLLLPMQSASEWNIAWRMAVCGIGFGLFQTPNNIVMVSATPIERTGSAGGMQSTARLVGQTLGATSVSMIFALSAPGSASTIALILAMCFAVTAGVFSLTRLRSNPQN